MNQNPALLQLVPFAAVAVIFYFLLIRPQQKQLKETKEMLDALKTGHKVVTRGGLIGHISSVKDDEIVIEVAKGVHVTHHRNAVSTVLSGEKQTEKQGVNGK